ncbi:MAG TPA: VOC family protein [Acidimicrobiales bacterium]|nr:VOC family protein [Acidimicrobiales bacterium]
MTFISVAPVIPVLDLDAALDRYRLLGFDVHSYDGEDQYGYAEREGVSLHITQWDEHDPKRTASVVYLYVSDANAVYDEWKASGVEGRFREPFDAEYGLREFAFVDVDGTLHRVGSRLTRT